MRKLITSVLCLAGATSFAQNGFFLQPEVGGGIGNAYIASSKYNGFSHYTTQNIFAWQGQMNVGYNAGKWQIITGIGYLRTGATVKNGTYESFYPEVLGDVFVLPEKITDYNMHITVPVKVGYEVLRFNDKLSFTPFIGAEYAFNMPRIFVYPTATRTETKQSFETFCNSNGVIGLAELNFTYRLSNHINLTGGPSVNYMFTSMLNFKQENDYAMLLNLGVKYSFKKRAATHNQKPDNQQEHPAGTAL